jgi:hypothetical protein
MVYYGSYERYEDEEMLAFESRKDLISIYD